MKRKSEKKKTSRKEQQRNGENTGERMIGTSELFDTTVT
jgi:hypothetical protein